MSDERELPEQVFVHPGRIVDGVYDQTWTWPSSGGGVPYLRADKPVGYVLVHYDTGEVKSDISQDPEELRAIRLYGEHVHPVILGPAIEPEEESDE